MKRRCQVCGKLFEVPFWSEEAEREKSGKPPAVFICESCQERIQAELQKQKSEE
ncbi:conserved protein of unknown function [Candidatus Hydrogenisulfobacillus filiaventi]|uniref:DUF2197 domain-containing protein n=1 Tax=Candidatus Hydrogenisulfobacillus filiaventi TaxID=2707344 RepID=A0A6F8ZFK5_9FIRM|nr:DUF2197 domain-containing protein [Bacillota bacterium]CAB1128714.1 conserved protein of unknown function [Candidatus Hydrogenisulfobacillus filiaventi]